MSKRWLTEDQDKALKDLNLDSLIEQAFTLSASIVDVQKVLSKPMKPMRKQISAVRFTDGRIEEITAANIGLVVEAAEKPEKTETTAVARVEKAKPTVAVSVAEPVIGCPAPDFDEAEVRATRVLEQFLDADQLADFREDQQFVVTGADSGHRYLLTSRHAPKSKFLHSSFRCVYNLDEQRDLCVHDWEVPAAEELLGLMICLQLPNLERHVNSLVE